MSKNIGVAEVKKAFSTVISEVGGLLAAIGAWEDFEDLDSMVSAIYERRKKSKDRSAGGLV